ncbi:hypothetical protein P170DRAFT_438930 [Aspergillus steynii IBT 23096]|uniref:Uncharacterized protein n=1 Tax=Aspergillus steynii IBT 23096 TaxID=1392250 RepID=A0A2I2G2Y0_9EURO|nr:uncharacterized protein P170DRAFT_438930 [Aspergillus steynii IBT 23096]PLB47229.1 hypothetical protein P170DRAFT_438930 [Aspergillus steynii IBT 23096]
MGAVRVPQIYLENHVSSFLQYILDNNASTILLIICSKRDEFLRRLLATVYTQSNESANSRQLVTKTLGLLSKSSRTQVAFCPTLEHLRAYLSVLQFNNAAEQETNAPEDQQLCRPLMAILDPLALHLSTSEFAAQGLSRTLAAAVETSSREAVDLVICECQDVARPEDSGEALWNAHVPLLNSSVRTGRDESTWGGQSVPVKRIAQRWFVFSDPRISTTNNPEV